MSYKIRILHPEGDDEIYEMSKQPSLEELQETVGGWIEIVPADCGDTVLDLIVHEEGKLLNLPYNPKASEYAGRPIVGTAVLFEEGRFGDG